MKILSSLRGRLLVLTIIAVALPMITSGYIMMKFAYNAFVEEKQSKLYGAARILDSYLPGSYDEILRQCGALEASREDKIMILHGELRKFTDLVAQAYPGIGVGYYSKELDAIITYGPSNQYDNTVGLPIGANHQGRLVMETGEPRVQEGNLVRGAIMNAMYPIIRDGKIIGYIWANELTEDITAQISFMKTKIFILILISMAVAIIAMVKLLDWLVAHIERIKVGINKLKNNLSYQLPVIKGELGEITLAINDMARELEARKLQEEQVQSAERLELLGEIAAGMAHEIRNPLMAVRGFAQLIKENQTPAESEEYMEIILKESDRMDKLTEELLCLARPAQCTLAMVEPNEVVGNALRLVENQTREKRLNVIRNLDPGVPVVLVEKEQLRQVILNILLNAIQASKIGGLLEISTDYEAFSNQVAIKIRDTGVGIAPEIIDKIFKPFFTTKEKGTGLGLSVALRLIENWGGRIMVDSTLGAGTLFTILLPTGGEGFEQSCVNS